ncbi:hypothetical protein TGME49_217370 [Toxoplasma gondii ME49]|uniref:Transmembrane protein n=4 Tax=Toxoplasma gondii TaxID=5811 RepID=A0A125YGJ3_TOXGM|nr:hypothetical protein TGME49_217370 [Toxoplasma gondii ME49]ESS34125.1 putative transmembrane protein [Toxoplasma gondii VEG]KYF48888.1 hypothetical protein TGARI_217370 [Toxoplasma gondii ARI]PIM04926.1 putative transmembrane protein [Toxoplasma gondii COUG]EPT24715.1 hypothetical protein TGME49_217370 [Toxoplasma gondii ME49]CEL78199.1 TPA: hypothetical protein BN1205_007160 [Toxoplasma gondii VEG]|eukprot:XP_002371304.1 hypothetical protein TGME49_217370 [Toxoplasma gondii ME49]
MWRSSAANPRERVVLLVALLISAAGSFFPSANAATENHLSRSRQDERAAAPELLKASLFNGAEAANSAERNKVQGLGHHGGFQNGASAAPVVVSYDAPSAKQSTMPRENKTVAKQNGALGFWKRVPGWAKVLGNSLAIAVLVSLAVKGKQVKRRCQTCLLKKRP